MLHGLRAPEGLHCVFWGGGEIIVLHGLKGGHDQLAVRGTDFTEEWSQLNCGIWKVIIPSTKDFK